jgi:enoyl-CoA hydratase/carnithine racemase
MTPSPNVEITRDGAVLCVTDRPDKKNALDRAMYMAATEALRRAGGDPSIGAVVFAGSGGVFTAGNDIADFLEASAGPGELPAFTFIKALAACETPLVAAIEGIAIGIGATMMLHCDLVYVAPGTVFRLPFVDLGLVPEAAYSLLLPRRAGMAKAAEFLLLGEAFGAGEAVRLGLVNAVVPACELRGFAIERAGQLGRGPRRLRRLSRQRALERDEAGLNRSGIPLRPRI